MTEKRKESLEERATREGGENELRGSRDAARALRPKQTRPQRREKR
jgi:hypothetical protein